MKEERKDVSDRPDPTETDEAQNRAGISARREKGPEPVARATRSSGPDEQSRSYFFFFGFFVSFFIDLPLLIAPPGGM
jgi:hypothetical protein